MSYSPPAANAIPFSFTVGGYAAPVGTGIAFSLVPPPDITGLVHAPLSLVVNASGFATIQGQVSTSFGLSLLANGFYPASGPVIVWMPIRAAGAGTLARVAVSETYLPLSLSAEGAATVSGEGVMDVPLIASGAGRAQVRGEAFCVLGIEAIAYSTVWSALGNIAFGIPLAVQSNGATRIVGGALSSVPLVAQATGSTRVAGNAFASMHLSCLALGELAPFYTGKAKTTLVMQAVADGAAGAAAMARFTLPMSVSSICGVGPRGKSAACLALSARAAGRHGVSGTACVPHHLLASAIGSVFAAYTGEVSMVLPLLVSSIGYMPSDQRPHVVVTTKPNIFHV